MKNYADEIIKILNKSYYIYNTFCFCVSGFQKENVNGLKTVFFKTFFFTFFFFYKTAKLDIKNYKKSQLTRNKSMKNCLS